MNVNLGSFRAMTQGKYNLGSVVVSTDAATHEQQLNKVDNHKYLSGRNVVPLPEENVKTRQVLSNLMKARLQQIAGADIASNAELRAEVAKLDTILLGDNIREKLDRKGALVEAFKAFDQVESRLLRTRVVTDKLRQGNAAKIKVEDKEIAPPADEVKQQGGSQGQAAQEPKKNVIRSIKFCNGESTEPLVLFEVEMRADDSEAVAAEKKKRFDSVMSGAETYLAELQSRETVEAAQEKEWGQHPELAPKGAPAGKAKDTARKLHQEDQAVVDMLAKHRSAEELRLVFSANPAAAHAVQKEVFGALQYLAKVQSDHEQAQADLPAVQRQPLPEKTVSVKMFVDNPKINTRTMDLTLKSDGRLELSLRGHCFELGYTAQEFNDIIKASSSVKARGEEYFSAFDRDNRTRAHVDCKDCYCAWNGNAKAVQKGPDNVDRVRRFPPENAHQVETKISEILDELRAVNNKSPHLWGGAPHYGNEMPQLEPLRHARFGNRTWAHIRSYCNQQIKLGGIHAVFGRALAKIQGVPLESGQPCGLCETNFEKAALFLNKVRILALNVNWIFSQFENQGNETDNDAIKRICTLVSDTCQLQLHPNEGMTMHTKSGLMETIRTLIQSTVNGFEMAKQNNDLPAYFTALASGACFQGCTTYVSEYCDSKFGSGASTPTSEYSKEVQGKVERQLERKIADLKSQQAELDSEMLDLEAQKFAKGDEASRQDLESRLSELRNVKLELGKKLKFWETRELGTGSVFMDGDGEIVLEMLPEKEKTKGRKAANAVQQSFEWSETPPFSSELLVGMMRDIYREIRFGDKKSDAEPIGVPPFFLPKVDMMVELIVERFKSLAEAAKEKGEAVKLPSLARELAKREGERANLEAALKLLEGTPSIKLFSLVDEHIQAARTLVAKTRELESSQQYKAREANINAKTAEIKATDAYGELMAQIDAKTKEVEESEVYRNLDRELEERLKTLEGSEAYRKVARELEQERAKVGAGVETYKELLDQEKELLAEQARVNEWLAKGRAARQRNDQNAVAALLKMPENALFAGWRNPQAEKSALLAKVQRQIAQLQPKVQRVLALEDNLVQLKKPYLDDIAAKQRQLERPALSELRARYDQMFQPVSELKAAHAQIRTEFLAPFTAKLAEVEEQLANFRKALPRYDEEHCSGKEREMIKNLAKVAKGISELLQKSGEGKVRAGEALAANFKSAGQAGGRAPKAGTNFPTPAQIKAEMEKELQNLAGRIQESRDRIGKVGSFELNLAMVMDMDSYGNQQNDFIYLSADDFLPGHEQQLADFKQKLKDELLDSGYVYRKTEVDAPPSYVIGEERFMLGELTKGVVGDGFVQSQWSEILHGSEFVRGLSKNGEDVLRSNEGIEINSPAFTRDFHRRNPDGDDYEYQDGDMRLEYLVG